MEAHHLALLEAVKTTEAPDDKEGDHLYQVISVQFYNFTLLQWFIVVTINAFK